MIRVTIDYIIGTSVTTDVFVGEKVSIQLFKRGRSHVRVDDTAYMYANTQRLIREENYRDNQTGS